jgi:hypothetical protein
VALFDALLALPHVYLWLPGVIFVVVAGGGYWLVRPSHQLAPAAPEAKVEAVDAEKTGDQRSALRRQGNPVEIYVATPDAKDNPVIGIVLDRSLGGVRLILYTEVDVGTTIAIRPIQCETIVPWVDVEVRSCRPSVEIPGRFEVGCQYVKSPPYSIQLLFG